MSPSHSRVPAHDLTAERALLACVILDPVCHAELVHAVRPEHFYADRHALIWQALQELDREHAQADQLTLRERLERAGKLQRVGGDEYLLALTDTIPTLKNGEHFATRVRELAAVRAVVLAAQNVLAEGYQPIESVPDYLARAQRAVSQAIDLHAVGAEPVHIGVGVDEVFDQLVARAGGKGCPVSTGLKTLDFVFDGGLWPGEVTILAGRPGTAKTSLALCISLHASRRSGPVLIHSLEMPRSQMSRRLLSIVSGVAGARIRQNRLSGDEMDRLRAAGDELRAGRIQIEDSSGVTMADIARNARRQKRRGGLALLVIDYLQLVRPVERDKSREREVSEISTATKRLARDLEIPVLAIASMNRDSEARGASSKKPTIAQLRESGSIESDADTVALLYRDEMHNAKSEFAGLCEVIVGKQRNGAIGSVDVGFQKELTRFHDVERRQS